MHTHMLPHWALETIRIKTTIKTIKTTIKTIKTIKTMIKAMINTDQGDDQHKTMIKTRR